LSLPAYRLAPLSTPPPRREDFGLAELIALLERRKILILKITGATVLAALLFAFSLPTLWTSAAVVMLEPRRNALADPTQPQQTSQIDAATLQNQLQILQSRELAERVITRLELDKDPEFNGTLPAPGLAALLDPRIWSGGAPLSGQRLRDQVVENFLANVSAEANGLSTSITVSARSRDPEKAARIANAVVSAYTQDQLVSKLTSSSQTAQWLDSRANSLAREMRLQNEEVQRFKARNHITDTAPGSSLNDQQLVAINAQLVAARSDLEQKLGMQRALAGRDPANSSQAVASPLIQTLRAQQSTLTQQEADLNLRYGPLHPKIAEIQVQRRDIDQRIAQETARITGSINGEVDAARNHLAALQGELARAQGVAVTQGMARSELASLEANANSTRQAFEAFIGKLRNAQDQDASLAAESRVLSPATVPQSPTSPKRKLILGASVPLGLMLGVLAALLLEKFGYLLRPKARRRNGAAAGRSARRVAPHVGGIDMDQWDGPPILGEINNARSLEAADYVLDWPQSRFAHASVALMRQLESRGGEGAVLALTSPEPGDYKSVVAVSLARAAARMGKKAVIIDCDPSHRSAMALHSQPQAGLYEVLTGAVSLNDALVKDPRSQAFLLTLKERPAQAAAMYASPQMTRLIDILRDSCDFVILDCSPALTAPDAALIARQADATLLVSRREKLKARSVSHATRMLQDAQAAPVGLVLAS
jgi:uncharacterized protein involved in exopolysaccharide biosynthesis/Mrp family chromosome partitioning ATPase